MADSQRKRGRTFGAKAFTQAEDDVIRLAIKSGTSFAEVARLLGRARSAIYARRAKVAAQLVLEMGQGDDHATR